MIPKYIIIKLINHYLLLKLYHSDFLNPFQNLTLFILFINFINLILINYFFLIILIFHPFCFLNNLMIETPLLLKPYIKSVIYVTVADGVLSIEGTSSEDKEEFVHKGIAKRAFKKQLQLAEHVECSGAKLEDGMLKINLKHNLPENKKAKQIAIK